MRSGHAVARGRNQPTANIGSVDSVLLLALRTRSHRMGGVQRSHTTLHYARTVLHTVRACDTWGSQGQRKGWILSLSLSLAHSSQWVAAVAWRQRPARKELSRNDAARVLGATLGAALGAADGRVAKSQRLAPSSAVGRKHCPCVAVNARN